MRNKQSPPLFSLIKTQTFIIVPLIILLIAAIINYLFNITLVINGEFRSNVVTVTGVLAGFLFTAMGILSAMPNNRFIEYIRKYKLLQRINRTILTGIISGISSLLLAIFGVFDCLMLTLFLVCITDTCLSVWYVYKVLDYSNRSV